MTADTTWGDHLYGYGRGGWGFAGQLGAGVTYALAQNIDLDFGYRFKAVSGVDLIPPTKAMLYSRTAS
ncbi:hypothetical protein [Mesorhizobium sp.]|uniref:hypothetical protein n=1 Tax=Mesorhizobium sp. TaxID=1871066 RepID=UPI00257A2275|nr:hypothetical protein [Mesorhizobium sp.]